jgi:hypothetical protein
MAARKNKMRIYLTILVIICLISPVHSENKMVVVGNQWDSYTTYINNKISFISFDVECDQDSIRSQFTDEALVRFKIKSPNGNGGPTGSESQELWDIEDNLIKCLEDNGIKCRFVGRLTRNGIRDFIIELVDKDKFSNVLDSCLKDNNYNPTLNFDKSWDLFDDVIWPDEDNWTFIYDDRVVRGLINSGSNPEKYHSLEYVFIGQAKELNQIENELKKRKYVKIQKTSKNEIVMAIKLKLDTELIFNETKKNKMLSEKYKCVCDGWGAEVVR